MNSRHAAVVILVGWYLIAPPVVEPKHEEPYLDEQAAYHDWKIVSTFSEQAQCEQERDRHTQDDDFAEFGKISVWAEQLLESDCIATADPRLTENQILRSRPH
jgi:hypothetical protein